jgi:hypothetical protein
MERKAKIELVVAIIALVLIGIFPLTVLLMESDSNLRLLAIGIILSIVLGGYNMLKELLGFPPLEFWNEVDNRTIKNKKEIRHVLYFTNNTKDKIPIRGYHFSVAKEGRDKPLIATDGLHFSSVVIPPIATKYPVPSPNDWFDPTKWGIESKGTYQIVWEVVYSYKEDTKVLTNVCTLEWEGT